MTCGIAVAEEVAASARPFVGRHWESGQLREVVAAGGAARVVVGEPGIGRTALLRHLADSTPHRVVWVRGSQLETELPYSGVAQLLTALAEYFPKVPVARRRALEIALALADGPTPGALAVCLGALSVLGAAARREPLLVLVDDLQWVDPESRRLFAYVGRRLDRERMALVMALRDEPDAELPDLPVLRMGGLDLADCHLLARAYGLPAQHDEVAAVADATGGNPMALIETLTRFPRPTGDLTVEVGTAMLPAWRGVLARLPAPTRDALVVLASARPATVEAVLAELGLSLRDLEPAERLGLLTDGLRLRHRLLGPVLTAAAPAATRKAVHLALAAHVGPELGPWYRSLAVTGPDEDLAEELVGMARRADEDEATARFLRRAAELTAAPAPRARLLLSAAGAAMRGGHGERAVSWCREAATLRTEPEFVAAAAVRGGLALELAGQYRHAYDELVGAAARVAPRDPVVAAELLCEAALPAMVMGAARLAHAAVTEAELLAEGAPLSARARVRVGAARAFHGLPDDETVLPSVAELAGEPRSLVQAALVHLWAERVEPARATVNAAIDQLRRDGLPPLLAVALAARSDLGYRTGGWAAAHADAMAAVDMAAGAAPNAAIVFGLFTLAQLAAARGEPCAQLLARGRVEAGRFGVDLRLLLEPAVRGLAALSTGEPGAAIEPLEGAWAYAVKAGVHNPNVVPFAADLAEAHARCGNRERAMEVVSWLDERAAALGLRAPSAAAWRCRGLLAADVDQAVMAFAAAHQDGAPFDHARTLLCEGEALRRLRRPALARSSLRRATDLFEGLGATAWAERSAAELAAAGHRSTVDERPVATEALTPQQVRIASMVAAGHNNVETAAALFLSRKTIEAHLTQVYRKLGVHSRTQLARALAEGSPEGGHAAPRVGQA